MGAPKLKAAPDTLRKRLVLGSREKKNKRRSVATVGAERIVLLAHELAEDVGHARGWRVRSAESLGMKAPTLYRLLREFDKDLAPRISTKTIDRVCAHLGCKVGDLLDDDL